MNFFPNFRKYKFGSNLDLVNSKLFYKQGDINLFLIVQLGCYSCFGFFLKLKILNLMSNLRYLIVVIFNHLPLFPVVCMF